jgi:CRISPR-associated protein Csx14
MWGAHQTAEGLINDMAAAIAADEINDKTVLESRTGMTGRIGLDVRSSWNTLDEGFSPNDQKLPVDSYPATELLAAIGLQTFVPFQQGESYVYACWSNPLPTPVARVVASGLLDLSGTTRYRFRIGERGKFRFFTKASSFERTTNGSD